MPQFAANLSFMYQESPFMARFAAAAADGFKGVEYLFPYDFPADELAAQLQAHRLEQVLFNLPPGDWDAGERGSACLPGRQDEFASGVEHALRYAERLGCRRVHVMAGIPPAGADRAECRRTYLDNLRHVCARAAKLGVTVLIEPINPRDMPGYFLNRLDEARGVIDEVGAFNLKLQIDFYHVQIVQGDLTTAYRQHRTAVGHVQIASVPERAEPDDGEINHAHLFRVLDDSAYGGWVGCEYRPRAGTSEGLGWLRAWRARL
jgi:hydroxypyruvate isomerase